MQRVIVIAHNLRSIHNVGSLLRTADGLGIETVYLTGYTPHPATANDSRMPHEVLKTERQIHKTALGAENTQHWRYEKDVYSVLQELRADGYILYGLEQADQAQRLPELRPAHKTALIIGREVQGIEAELLTLCDATVEIPMFGQKESYNVIQAAAMAMYHCRFMTTGL